MKKNTKLQGFTLIELLVVISIIAMLLSILMPSLAKVRKQAQAVVCMANLHSMSQVWCMYLNESNSRFHTGWLGDYTDYSSEWPLVLKPYYTNLKILVCPSAKKTLEEGGANPFMANTFNGDIWGEDLEDKPFSYGSNGWINNIPSDNKIEDKSRLKNYWKTSNVKRALINIPVFLDSYAVTGRPDVVDELPRYNGDMSAKGKIQRFMIDRHDGYVNSIFLDFSLRKVGLKGLLKLNWHKHYDTNARWDFSQSLWLDKF